MSLIFLLIPLISCTVILSVGCLLWSIKIPINPNTKKLCIARNTLALTYITLALLSFAELYIFKIPHSQKEIGINILIVGAFQAFMFTYALLVFIRPDCITKKQIILHISILTGISACFLCLKLFFSDHIILFIASIIYSLLLTYCVIIFRRLYNNYKNQILDSGLEKEYHRIRWIQIYFYALLSIGIMAMATIYLPQWFYCVFMVSYTCFYVSFAGKFNNYLNKHYYLFAPIHENLILTQFSTKKDNLETQSQALSLALEIWVREKRYLNTELNREEIASELNTNKRFLQYYFNIIIKEDFRTWRTKLRVEEAKNILIKHPDIPMSEIAIMAGFSDRSNFNNQFRKTTGLTPKEWYNTQKNYN